MEVWYSGKLKIIELGLDEDPQEDGDLYLFENVNRGDYIYPTKISFQFSVPADTEQLLKPFKSSKRSSIRKRVREINEEYETKTIESISKQEFLDWQQGYSSNIQSKEFGENKLASDWFETRSEDHIMLAYYKDGGMSGGIMAKIFPNKLSMSYAWYNDEIRRKGASTAAIISLVQYCIDNNKTTFSFGQDANLFGGHLSYGLHDFKREWNTEVATTKAAEMKGLKLAENISDDKKPFLFYEKKEEGLVMIEIK